MPLNQDLDRQLTLKFARNKYYLLAEKLVNNLQVIIIIYNETYKYNDVIKKDLLGFALKASASFRTTKIQNLIVLGSVGNSAIIVMHLAITIIYIHLFDEFVVIVIHFAITIIYIWLINQRDVNGESSVGVSFYTYVITDATTKCGFLWEGFGRLKYPIKSKLPLNSISLRLGLSHKS